MTQGIHCLLLLLSTIAGCATAARQPTTPPTDVEWTLVELEGTPAIASPTGSGARLRFASDPARVTGFTTCNQFFGSYEAPGQGRLRFSQLGSTKMACVEPERARQEARFMDVLQRVDQFAVVGDTLILIEREQPRARLVAAR